MSHYPDYEHATDIDQKTLTFIQGLDPGKLYRSCAECLKEPIPNLSTALCGLSSVATVMMTVKELGGNGAKILHYANSGDISIDGYRKRRTVVGYGAVAFYKQ